MGTRSYYAYYFRGRYYVLRLHLQPTARGTGQPILFPERLDDTRYWSSRYVHAYIPSYIQLPNMFQLFELWMEILTTYRVEQIRPYYDEKFSMMAHTYESILQAKPQRLDQLKGT